MGLFSILFGKKEEVPLLPQINQQQAHIPSLQNLNENNFPEKDLSTTIKELEGSPDKAPFFVRIDKFINARDNLKVIAKRLKEMDKVLEKIHDVKIKEDEELSAWKEEIKLIRENLAKIDEDIFNKL